MISEKIEKYASRYSTEEDKLLHELYRETHLKMMYPRMLSGHLQGRLLEMISHMINPKYILEIGTFTGYSAICLSKGLQTGGKLLTIEINPELTEFAGNYFEKAGISDCIEQKTGNALDIIPGLNEKWDLVFIDADKENYLSYYQLVLEQVNPGGFILVDNVLWGGKVLDPDHKQDKETQGIVEFSNFVRDDNRVEHVLLTVRDGLMVLRKR